MGLFKNSKKDDETFTVIPMDPAMAQTWKDFMAAALSDCASIDQDASLVARDAAGIADYALAEFTSRFPKGVQ
jgi:chloramphenicol O-acetyltransferase